MISKMDKFLFNNEFTGNDNGSFSIRFSKAGQKEYDEAFNSGYESGYQNGFQESQEHSYAEFQEHYRTSFIQNFIILNANIPELIQKQKEYGEEVLNSIVNLSSEIASKLIPTYVEKNGFDEIKTVIEKVCSPLTKPQEIILFLHPDNMKAFEEYIKTQNVVLAENFDVRAKDNLGLSDCILEWENGGAQRILSKIQADIENCLSPFIKEHSQQETDHVE